MVVFYVILLLTFFLSLLARKIYGKINKPSLFITLIITAILVLVSGLRNNNIGDTAAYYYLYKMVGSGQVLRGSYEAGFILFLSLLQRISANPQFMIFITALITNYLNIWMLRKYNNLFELQTFMYITSGYYVATMNGIRQALVASVLYASTKFIIEGKFLRYLFITVVMYTFHASALIMIPVYFIARQDVWSKKIRAILLILPIVFILFEPLMSTIFETLAAEGSRYASYEASIMTGGEGGTNVFRVFIAAVPVVLAYIGRRKLKKEWPESNVFVNMSLINLIVMMFSLFNWVFSRFQFYFLPYNFILLPYLIKTLFKEKQLIYFLFILCYSIYFYYEHTLTLNINYVSDYF